MMMVPPELRARLVAHVAEGKRLGAAVCNEVAQIEVRCDQLESQAAEAERQGQQTRAMALTLKGNTTFDQAEALRGLGEAITEAAEGLEIELQAANRRLVA